MTIIFISDYINHYQASFAECVKKQGIEYWFVSIDSALSEERKKLGFSDKLSDMDYILNINEDYDKVKNIIDRSEIVISAYPHIEIIQDRLKNNGLTFLESERIFKKSGVEILGKLKNVFRFIKYKKLLNAMRKKSNCYYLLIGRYTIEDYIRLGINPDKILKFAYFPEKSQYTERVYNQENQWKALWVGRLVKWKHPEHAVNVIKRLQDEGEKISLTVVGNGAMESALKESAKGYDISFTGGASIWRDQELHARCGYLFVYQ